ncbi:UDP-N-acetylglucosamine transferase subunit [Paramecium bursaria]
MILFGSGGHTTEMLYMFEKYNFKERNQNLYFIHSESDQQEPTRVYKFIEQNNIQLPQHKWITIPRSRKVKQSYLSSIFTTLYAIVITFIKLFQIQDLDLLVINGPGTCLPVVLVLWIQYLFLFRIKRCKILYIESWCRVQKLSLTGKLIYRLCDRFITHWNFGKGEYLGPLI